MNKLDLLAIVVNVFLFNYMFEMQAESFKVRCVHRLKAK